MTPVALPDVDTDLDVILLEGLDFEPECESAQCGRGEAHAAQWLGYFTCAHSCFACDKARGRWELKASRGEDYYRCAQGSSHSGRYVFSKPLK